MDPIRATVKWFRGSFGFLAGDDGRDFFVHFSAIEVDDRTDVREGKPFRRLAELQEVEVLAWILTEKGWKATKVRKL